MVFIIPIILGLIIGTQLIDNSNNDLKEEIQDSCNLRYENNNRYIKEYVIPSKCSAPVAITIDSAENVGIGVTSPAEVLHIREPSSGSDTTLLIDEVNGNNAQLKMQSNRDNSSTYRGTNIFNYVN